MWMTWWRICGKVPLLELLSKLNALAPGSRERAAGSEVGGLYYMDWLKGVWHLVAGCLGVLQKNWYGSIWWP